MARFAIKALVVTALVCLVFDLAASEENHQHHEQEVHQQGFAIGSADKDAPETTTSSGSFKDKFKGFVSSVKEGASDTLDNLNEKRKEAYAGTKKLVNGVIEKVKTTFHKASSEEDVPRSPESSEEHVKDAANKAKDAVVDKTQSFMKSEKLN